MKRLFIALLACVVIAGAAGAQTVTSTVAKWNSTALSGRLIASGSASWPLTTLQDADSSVTSTVIDLTAGASRLPGVVVLHFDIASAAGGSAAATATNIVIQAFYHATSTATAGSSAYVSSINNLFLGGWSVAGLATKTMIFGSATAASVPFIFGGYTSIFGPYVMQPRYVSFMIDKEGGGHYTGGTMTIYWECYAP